MDVALLALAVLWLGLITYAVLGGADFGAGVWALFALGRQAERQRQFINHALGPVWEANHVWLIFLIVGLFNVFPSAFASLSIALFIPFSLALVGIVLRGAAFIFRYYAVDEQSPFARAWARVFSVSSLLTPFFLGAGAAAVASGHLLASDDTALATNFAAWTSPFALAIGAIAVTLCGTLAAVYLAEEAYRASDAELTAVYRMRGLIAGAITAVLGALALYFSTIYAPLLWSGMLQRAIPVVVATMLIGLATAVFLYTRRYRLARIMIIAETAFLLGSWGLSQYPYVIPPHITIDAAANEPYVITTLLVCIAIGLVILIPSLYYLFSVFKLSYPVPGLRRDVIEQDKKEQVESKSQKGVGAV